MEYIKGPVTLQLLESTFGFKTGHKHRSLGSEFWMFDPSFPLRPTFSGPSCFLYSITFNTYLSVNYLSCSDTVVCRHVRCQHISWKVGCKKSWWLTRSQLPTQSICCITLTLLPLHCSILSFLHLHICP